jgi:hypothetical protein
MREREQWGSWRYLPCHRILRHDKPIYEIPLDQCHNSATILDWIAQISGKGWANDERTNDETVGSLVRALDDLLHLQGNVCGGAMWGMTKSHEIDPKAILRRRQRGATSRSSCVLVPATNDSRSKTVPPKGA